ncbi:MAG TPA: DegT/DnrJ/EryC1/StrS family aminotransferase, partial [Bryobacteraceae bacterium]|nr:DegT/DnrJ/EryC1/StrS family aminotransferase [Bryobacteraceae bacterium]
EVDAFESEFAAWCGARQCVGTGNGTDALELALRAVGVTAGSRVATVANAGMYSTAAILACGATPVFVDVDPDTLNVTPELLSPLSADAVVVTHLYGRMAPVEAICKAVSPIPVIEDCAQSHGAVLNGKRAGTWGVAGCFSFYPTKNLGACGDGGAVVTSSPELAQRVRVLRQYGWTARYRAEVPGGRNSRLDELQAAVLRLKLPLLTGWNQRRRDLAALMGIDRGRSESDVVHLLVIQHAERDRLRDFLRQRGIASDVHYPVPDYRQPAVTAVIGETLPLPQTERACAAVLTLPCFPEMTDEEAMRVREAVNEFR